MKTIVEINTTNYASTGTIMNKIAVEARKEGYKVYTCVKSSKESYKYQYDNQLFIGFRFERILSSLLATITGLRDHFNIFGTYRFVSQLKKINPDLIHLHVLHDDFINIRILFAYLRKTNIPVVWTFHDCAAMTGKCPYFTLVNCDKWINGCHNCPQLNNYTKSLIDTTSLIWHKRKKYFTSLNNLTITTPSKWLESLVRQSYFKKYKTLVIPNGIDLNIFKPSKDIDSIRDKYHISKDKYVVLGVANIWIESKGLYDFIELSKVLPNNYQVVLVGTNDEVDKILPSNIISIHRTYNQKELVDLYSCADVFVNPTKQEVFGLVNVEALACGTPVLVYNSGGCPEIVNSKCGKVIDINDINSLAIEIKKTCLDKPYKEIDCLKQAIKFDANKIYKKYLNIYSSLLN